MGAEKNDNARRQARASASTVKCQMRAPLRTRPLRVVGPRRACAENATRLGRWSNVARRPLLKMQGFALCRDIGDLIDDSKKGVARRPVASRYKSRLPLELRDRPPTTKNYVDDHDRQKTILMLENRRQIRPGRQRRRPLPNHYE